MKRTTIRAFIAVVTIALVGLIAIQFYWIDNALDLKEDEFKRNANDALARVVSTLEKEEALKRMRSHREGRALFFNSDSLTNNDAIPADSNFNFIIMRQVESDGINAEITITEERDGERIQRSTTTAVEELDSINQDLTIQIGGEQRESFETIENNATSTFDSLLMARLVKKRAFIGEIVESLVEVDLNEPIEKRVKKDLLDSLISTELRAAGITTPYEFALLDTRGDSRLASTSFPLEPGNTHDIRARLFPNDVLPQRVFLELFFPKKRGYLLRSSWLILSTSTLIILAIALVFYFAIATIITQKKNSEIKNDFINNMTHELKTPISTISLACEALEDPDIGNNQALNTRYIAMISDENKRLGMLVEEVLQSAVFDKGEFKLKLEETDLHSLINAVCDKINMQIADRSGQLVCNLKAEHSRLKVDRVHVSNVLYNLIDNANKYSKNTPEISIETHNTDGHFVIAVSDKGIGIASENQKRVFERLYRVPTGNVHDVKGFGLGLSYVKIIVERHGGYVSLTSELGKGSTFKIYLPLYEKV